MHYVCAKLRNDLTDGRKTYIDTMLWLVILRCTVGWGGWQCDVSMRLADGKIGGTALELAEATAAVDAERRCTFNAAARPADAAGHLKLSGSVPLPQPKARDGGGDGKGAVGRDGGEAGQIEVDAAVKDSGMMLLCAAVPGLRWQQGLADITVRPSPPSIGSTALDAAVSAVGFAVREAVCWLSVYSTALAAEYKIVPHGLSQQGSVHLHCSGKWPLHPRIHVQTDARDG